MSVLVPVRARLRPPPSTVRGREVAAPDPVGRGCGQVMRCQLVVQCASLIRGGGEEDGDDRRVEPWRQATTLEYLAKRAGPFRSKEPFQQQRRNLIPVARRDGAHLVP